MKNIAIGFKAHSGWAAVVIVCRDRNSIKILDRRRIELVNPDAAGWAKQPYHAAKGLPPSKAKEIVLRGIQSANTLSRKCITNMVKEFAGSEYSIHQVAILVGTGMPGWTLEQILSVHIRMHKAEGELFRNALIEGAVALKLPVLKVPEKDLLDQASVKLGLKPREIERYLTQTGKKISPPWGRDQKDAALAAWECLV